MLYDVAPILPSAAGAVASGNFTIQGLPSVEVPISPMSYASAKSLRNSAKISTLEQLGCGLQWRGASPYATR